MLVLLMARIYYVCLEMASCGMIYRPSLMKIGARVQAVLRVCVSNLTGCNVGITYHSFKESYRLCKKRKKITELKKRPGPSKGCRAVNK
jgi:hypothetical protein